MDFRSQLSAFKNESSRSSNAGTKDLNNDRGRTPSNTNDTNSNYSRDKYCYSSNRHSSPNRGGTHYDGAYGGDRLRQRPREWNQNANYHQGPPTARRRFHPPRHGSPGHGHGPPNLDGLGEMRNLGYRIPRGFPPVPTEEERKRKSKHVALLAISIDDLPYENIWKGWCETLSSAMKNSDGEVDEYFVSFACHAKFPEKVKSDWLRQRLLTYPPKQGRGNSFMDPVYLSRTPEWGSVEITRAMLDLLQDGLKIGNFNKNNVQYDDKRFCASRYLVRSPISFNPKESTHNTIPAVDHFLFISESCIPVVTASELFSKISDSNISWLNARHRTENDTPKNKYEDDQFAGINRRIPGQYRWKADQWVILSRRHASSIISMDRPFKPPKHQLWQSFRNINASDEMFFPTALALLGDLRYTKDGYDTQKGRSRDKESSHGGHSTPLSTSPSLAETNTCSQNQTNKETGSYSPAINNSQAPVSSPSSQNQCIILQPVTYTDWTEGMKNPATFTKGPTDFKRVAKLARDMGCLVARKFSTHASIPGIPLEERKYTGYISTEEWESIIEGIQNVEGEKSNEVRDNLATAVSNNGGNSGTTKTNEPEDRTTDNGGKDNCDDIKSRPLDAHCKREEDDIISSGLADQDNDNDDDDDDENQLE